MNLNIGWKEICIDYNDQEMEDEDEDDDEPDFMDNSGKCWEFGSKIVDEKHLKEWCQNKMGGMIVGKEEKLTRQFHCQIKQCQFKAIFLKSFSIVYTRNKHNHPMENAKNNRQGTKEEKKNPSSSLLVSERDYVDRDGKLWSFHANIGKNITHDKLLKKFGFSSINNYGKTTLNLHCRKRNLTDGRCTFAGIYLKLNGCLYTRGEHEHSQNGKIPQNVGEDYVDHRGQIWKFKEEVGKNVHSEILLDKYGFTIIRLNQSTVNFYCEKKAPNGICKFSGVYLKTNGCLYTRGKHNHAHMEKNPKPNVGDDYVDFHGKVWPFHAKIGKQNNSNEIFRNSFGFTTIYQRQQTVNLYCLKRMVNGGKCPFTGIYVKENGCLYIRGKHEHKHKLSG